MLALRTNGHVSVIIMILRIQLLKCKNASAQSVSFSVGLLVVSSSRDSEFESASLASESRILITARITTTIIYKLISSTSKEDSLPSLWEIVSTFKHSFY